jgi:hypothetical protein
VFALHDIEENIIIKAFALLRFDTLAITVPHYSISRGVFAVSERVYKRGLCCSWRCLRHRGLSCIWICLHYRGMCCSLGYLPQRPELQLDFSELQRRVLLLEMSTKGACATPGLVRPTVACASPGHVYP